MTADTPAPAAPSLGELCELSLTALVNAPGAFARLAARPAPGPGASLFVALAWGVLFFALNLIRVALSNPAALQAYAPWQLAAVGAAGLVLWAGLYLLGAGLVYGLGRTLGSTGGFDRALLVAAVMLAAAPVQALCGWVPLAWILPASVAAWIMACGLHSLFKAGAWAARGVGAALAAGILGLQYGAARVADAYSAVQPVLIQQQIQEIQTVAEESNPNDQDAPNGQSSLDLLRGAGDSAIPPPGPSQREQLAKMNAAGDALNKSAVDMLDSIAPMLDNPALTRNMTTRQKSDYAELKKMIAELKNDITANAAVSPREQQARMLKIQRLLMGMMSKP